MTANCLLLSAVGKGPIKSNANYSYGISGVAESPNGGCHGVKFGLLT